MALLMLAVCLCRLSLSIASLPGVSGCHDVVSTARPPADEPCVDMSNVTRFSVPFYVYEFVDWLDMTCDEVPLNSSEFFTTTRFKHSDDYWFLQSALSHPMRTQDPSKARIFVVGGLLNVIVDQISYAHERCCVRGMCNGELLVLTDRALGRSEWFNRSQGADHIIVASHYKSVSILMNYKHIALCNTVCFEDNHLENNRVHLPSLYVGRPCRPMERKSHDFAMIAKMKRFRYRDRRNICNWIQAGHYNASVCGFGEQCPALAVAKYGFHSRGDTFGSSRLMDTLLSGTVPIFTRTPQYKIIPQWIPWEKISEFVNMSSRVTFRQSVDGILADKTCYWQKQRAVEDYMHLFRWPSGVPFAMYMNMFACVRAERSSNGRVKCPRIC